VLLVLSMRFFPFLLSRVPSSRSLFRVHYSGRGAVCALSLTNTCAKHTTSSSSSLLSRRRRVESRRSARSLSLCYIHMRDSAAGVLGCVYAGVQRQLQFFFVCFFLFSLLTAVFCLCVFYPPTRCNGDDAD
jgi:hypothetical protein